MLWTQQAKDTSQLSCGHSWPWIHHDCQVVDSAGQGHITIKLWTLQAMDTSWLSCGHSGPWTHHDRQVVDTAGHGHITIKLWTLQAMDTSWSSCCGYSWPWTHHDWIVDTAVWTTGRMGGINCSLHLHLPLTAGMVGAPQMTPQPVSSIFLCSPLPSGTWWTPGLSVPWCCLNWLPFLQWLYYSFHFFIKDGRVIVRVCLETVQYRWSPMALWLYGCSLVHISHSSVRHFPEWSWKVIAFPCFSVVKFFYELVCLLTVVLPHILFNLTTLLS